MDADRQYRVADATFGMLAWLMVFGGLSIVVTIGSDGSLPGAIRAGLIVAGLGGIAAVVAWARVAGTGVDPDGVTVRGLLRTRLFGWSEIQAIQIEHNAGGYVDERGPRRIAVLYDAAGHRVPLPHVNEKNLARMDLDLATEVELMRADWERQREPAWTPVPSVQRKAAERARHRFTPWAAGVVIATFSIPVATVLVIVGLFTHADTLPAPLSWPFQPASILLLPVLVGLITALVSALARRRARP